MGTTNEENNMAITTVHKIQCDKCGTLIEKDDTRAGLTLPDGWFALSTGDAASLPAIYCSEVCMVADMKK